MKFKDVCRVINGRAYKLNELLEKGKYQVLRVGNFFTNSEMLYSDLELESDKYCEDDDLLFAWSASFGPKIYRGPKSIYHYHIWKLQVDDSKADKYYLYYWLLNNVRRMQAGGHGSVMAHITKQDMENQEIDLPPLQLQKRIAGILNSLDEKMDNNALINKNLEQQAQAIYEELFIKKANPQWETGLLSDLVEVKYGKDHKKLADGGYPVYGSGGIMRYVERPLYSGESVLIPRKGTLNNVMYVNGAFWSVDTMFYTKMQRPNVAKFVFHFIKSKDLASLNAGSAVPSMTTNILNAMQLRIPYEKTLREFEELVLPMYKAMQENETQSSRLASIRDALLPRLMSGELDVSGIDL